jgi:hypothetical protein
MKKSTSAFVFLENVFFFNHTSRLELSEGVVVNTLDDAFFLIHLMANICFDRAGGYIFSLRNYFDLFIYLKKNSSKIEWTSIKNVF